MEQELSKCATVRLVDIDKEILKGKRVKPGILDDDTQPGPSKRSKLTIAPAGTEALPMSPSPQAFILKQPMSSILSAPDSIVLNSVPIPRENAVQQTVVQPEDKIKCVRAEEPPPILWNKPSILRRPPPLVTQTVPVEKMWSEIKNGVRFLHPSNLDQNVITKVSDTLKTKTSLKNTIISLPNSVYLVPLSCFKGAQLPPDSMVSLASNDKVAVVENKKETEVKQVLKHPCWNSRRNRKLDLDGFTAYDRLGFYKAEAVRAKKCQKNVEAIIDKLRQSMLNTKEGIEILKSRASDESMAGQKEKKRLPEKTLPPEAQNSKRSISRKVRLTRHESIPYIDHTNVEKFHLYKSCIFVNKNSVVTEIILKTFPDFKVAVDSGAVKIISEQKTVKSTPQVEQDANKLMQFVKFLRDSHNLLDVMNDHSYAANENSMCIHNSDELLRPRRKSAIVD